MKLKQEQQREYLFDNYKVLLIILVVIGHFIVLRPEFFFI